MNFRQITVLGGLLAASVVGFVPGEVTVLYAAPPPKPSISEEASAALLRMGQTLRAEQFSFQARTIRVYAGADGELLHIFHTLKVIVHRPDKLLVDVTGDDGGSKLVFDGKTLSVFAAAGKKYASISMPGTIQKMMEAAVGRADIDFPLADFLSEAPNKAFLTGVTSGREVNTVMIDGVPCRHFVFNQPPGIELELWVEKNDQSLPRRLIVTYRSLPGEPRFVAEFSDWNFSIHPSDAEFVFQPPEGAVRVELKPAAAAASGKGKGTK